MSVDSICDILNIPQGIPDPYQLLSPNSLPVYTVCTCWGTTQGFSAHDIGVFNLDSNSVVVTIGHQQPPTIQLICLCTTDMPGHRLARSGVKDTSLTLFDKYQCPYCEHLLKDAVQPICGHWLCESCAAVIFSSNSPKCPRPECQEDLKEDTEEEPEVQT